MSIFNRKKIVLEDFCQDFYENQILNPKVGKVKVGNVLSEVIKKNLNEVQPGLIKVDMKKLNKEISILRFELFALAWTHKFGAGEKVVAQSAFTKDYLINKERNDIWKGMGHYTDFIDSATLHWLTSLKKRNLVFNYRMREDLTKENIKSANKLGINIDESIDRVNKRLWSENAWRQKKVLEALVIAFCKRIDVNPKELNNEALLGMASIIRGFYDGAKYSWSKVKIVDN